MSDAEKRETGKEAAIVASCVSPMEDFSSEFFNFRHIDILGWTVLCCKELFCAL